MWAINSTTQQHFGTYKGRVCASACVFLWCWLRAGLAPCLAPWLPLQMWSVSLCEGLLNTPRGGGWGKLCSRIEREEGPLQGNWNVTSSSSSSSSSPSSSTLPAPPCVTHNSLWEVWHPRDCKKMVWVGRGAEPRVTNIFFGLSCWLKHLSPKIIKVKSVKLIQLRQPKD